MFVTVFRDPEWGRWYVLYVLGDEGCAAIRQLPEHEQEQLKKQVVSAKATRDMRVHATVSFAIAAQQRCPAHTTTRRYGVSRARGRRARNVRTGPRRARAPASRPSGSTDPDGHDDDLVLDALGVAA
jgi:hypothetical protein